MGKTVEYIIQTEVMGTINHITKSTFPVIKKRVKERAYIVAELDSHHRILSTYQRLYDYENLDKYSELIVQDEKKLKASTKTLLNDFQLYSSKHYKIINYLIASSVICLSSYFRKFDLHLSPIVPCFASSAGLLNDRIEDTFINFSINTPPSKPSDYITDCLTANPEFINRKYQVKDVESTPIYPDDIVKFIPPFEERVIPIIPSNSLSDDSSKILLALTSYQALHEDELSFEMGDEIRLLSKNDEGVCEGECNGVIGTFSECYTKPLR